MGVPWEVWNVISMVPQTTVNNPSGVIVVMVVACIRINYYAFSGHRGDPRGSVTHCVQSVEGRWVVEGPSYKSKSDRSHTQENEQPVHTHTLHHPGRMECKQILWDCVPLRHRLVVERDSVLSCSVLLVKQDPQEPFQPLVAVVGVKPWVLQEEQLLPFSAKSCS